ncbi:MAG: fumarylacetoacetate hydrolase family protein [Chlorobi bacterium]|nr:fumarylacetoacetate hydrolase family protein [Chlorobiota bacterium]
MRIRRCELKDGTITIVTYKNGQWLSLKPIVEEHNLDVSSILHLLKFYKNNADLTTNFVNTIAHPADINKFLPPLKPLSLRGFMLWEKHFMAAKRGLIALSKPSFFSLMKWFLNPDKKPSILKPPPMFYKAPIYYMGNHLQAYFDSQEIQYPSYTQWLDFEAEIGIIIIKKVRNIQETYEAEEAIGGFLIVNDFSARDMQIQEFKESLFGPVVKAKNFATGFSYDVATPDEIISNFNNLTAKIYINNTLVVEGSTSESQYQPADMVKYASLEETLYPGEILSTGTIPNCCAIEHFPEKNLFLKKGDNIKIEINKIGTSENTIS